MSYRVELSRTATKQLDTLPRNIALRISARLKQIESNPRPNDCKKLRGLSGYRIRVGEYRVLYHIKDNILIVLVVGIGHRRDLYR